jgi:hypothetical protein
MAGKSKVRGWIDMDQEIVHDAERATPPLIAVQSSQSDSDFLVGHHSAKLNVHQGRGRKVE